MRIDTIIKRDGTPQVFRLEKITEAVHKALIATDAGGKDDASKVANLVFQKIVAACEGGTNTKVYSDGIPTVEGVQDLVERSLMELGYLNAAKAYILYRAEHAKERERRIFKKRTHLKPYEYPELIEYVDAIRHSYWVHTEFNFMSDIHDFHVNISDAERGAIKNALLAIAQIEVAVKTFWGDIYKRMPKPEIGAVGFTFAESEVRHMDAYSHLLEILGLNEEFKRVSSIPSLSARVSYLEKVILRSRTSDDREYAEAVLLFSLFIEHVSLFSQFLVIMSFNKFKNLFKGISNAVEATSKEEQIHGLFGADIIKIVRTEHPAWFTDAHEQLVYQLCREAYEAESAIIDWIFEAGELSYVPVATVKEFVKNRFNASLLRIGMHAIFPVDDALVWSTSWFDDEVIGTKHGDFFVKRSINYNKRARSITSTDLF
ncbi:ribonucleotide-diphosphate reductase subunit beta [Candidatus Kaiserbacteria bacterium]|nr:ribonucleotide-diphosphate reductase subunit beta [Candidatus Kaiserbacteria bacterium]